MVSYHFEQFLGSLEKKMKLNEMRLMKEPNYSMFRQLIRDPQRMGYPFIRQISVNGEALGISKNTFNLVYEGFWDIYCKKPGSADITLRKLDGWLNHIRLVST